MIFSIKIGKMIYSKRYKTLINCIVFSLITACSTSLKKVQELSEKSLYDQAIENYNKLPIKDKAGLDVTPIKHQRLAYEKNLMNEIEQLMNKQAFSDAQKKIDEGMRNIPSSQQLRGVGAKLEKQKEKYIQKYQELYNFEYARYLIKERTILEQLKRVKVNDKAFNALYKSRSKDYLKYSKIIGQQGIKEIEIMPPGKVRELLSIAQQLNEEDRWQVALNTIEKKEASNKEKKELETKEKIEHQRRQLIEKIKQLKVVFNTDFHSGDLLASKSHLKEIRLLDNTDVIWIQNAQTELNKAIDNELEDALKKGQHFYSRGEIATAIKIWSRALVFSPKDKRLNENIERAERFEEKLEELTQPN